MKFVAQSVFVLLFISCNSSSTSTETNNKTAESASDSLMHEIFRQHDIGMAKMNKISEAKNRIQHNLDSISKLSFDLQKRTVQYKMELDSVFNRLTFADSHMETWMNEFNMDSLKDDREKQIKYLESEKIKISQVNDEMISGLHKVDSLLQKK